MNGFPVPTKILDGSGRREVAQLILDRGEPWKWSNPTVVNVSGATVLQEFISIPFTRDPDTGRPALVQGALLVGANVVDTTGADILAMDVRVDAFLGSTFTTIARRNLAGNGEIMVVRFLGGDTYDRISISAAELRNGTFSDGSFVTNPGTGNVGNETIDHSGNFFLTGATFSSANIGGFVQISGATNPANNGRFKVNGVIAPLRLTLDNAGTVFTDANLDIPGVTVVIYPPPPTMTLSAVGFMWR